MMKTSLTRREFNRLGGTALATAVLSRASTPAAAQSGQVVVGTWGDDYQNLLEEHIAKVVMKPLDIEVVYDTANNTVRKTKLMAERRLPRGSMDIAALGTADSYEMWKNGAFEELDYAKMPNAVHIVPK